MSGITLEERLMKAVAEEESAPNSLDGGPHLKATTPKAAVRRCCDAWQRAYDAYLAKDDHVSRSVAASRGGDAYRKAMPMLAGYEGVRDFIACTAHGLLIGAIDPAVSSQLLYAAQITLNALPYAPPQSHQTRPKRSGKTPPSPTPLQKALISGSEVPTNKIQ